MGGTCLPVVERTEHTLLIGRGGALGLVHRQENRISSLLGSGHTAGAALTDMAEGKSDDEDGWVEQLICSTTIPWKHAYCLERGCWDVASHACAECGPYVCEHHGKSLHGDRCQKDEDSLGCSYRFTRCDLPPHGRCQFCTRRFCCSHEKLGDCDCGGLSTNMNPGTDQWKSRRAEENVGDVEVGGGLDSEDEDGTPSPTTDADPARAETPPTPTPSTTPEEDRPQEDGLADLEEEWSDSDKGELIVERNGRRWGIRIADDEQEDGFPLEDMVIADMDADEGIGAGAGEWQVWPENRPALPGYGMAHPLAARNVNLLPEELDDEDWLRDDAAMLAHIMESEQWQLDDGGDSDAETVAPMGIASRELEDFDQEDDWEEDLKPPEKRPKGLSDADRFALASDQISPAMAAHLWRNLLGQPAFDPADKCVQEWGQDYYRVRDAWKHGTMVGPLCARNEARHVYTSLGGNVAHTQRVR